MYNIRYDRAGWLAKMFEFIRFPVLIVLCSSAILQFGAAFFGELEPKSLNVPDLIPPVNTVVLALLWWRISQLEKFKDKVDRRDEDDARRYRGR